MGALLTRLMRGSLDQVRHVTPVRPDAAPDLVARVYAQMTRDFGMLAPPVALHSPAPACLAACWLMLRESLLAGGRAGRRAREAVAVRVSAANACPYCVDVHRATLRGLGGSDPAREAPPAASPGAGFGEELAGVATTFEYLNRMVNVFLGASPLPPQVPARARGAVLRLFSLIMGLPARRSVAPGDSLDLLPEAPLPGDLHWAAGSPHLAGAFGRAAAAIEAAGRRSVPGPVRELVTERLGSWDGAAPGPSRAWAAEAVAGLPRADRHAGRLALLTALASYQVDGQVIEEFRRDVPGDRELIELTAWASMAAARRVGARSPYALR
ncbi:carboxymuconolactone decarboxylase family protein [Sphaerimonospora sp. CA-214678]|uniref:carboxymuconolactone decarboxylase family protein n=1 Tax=Sphaerimonospora sp. CA-214678 TaxID=3240029 RepID=UPI003D8D9050